MHGAESGMTDQDGGRYSLIRLLQATSFIRPRLMLLVIKAPHDELRDH